MLVIWRGYGWLIPIIVFGGFLLSEIAMDDLYGEGFYQANEWPKILAILVSTVLIGSLGYYFNYKKRQVIVDPETGKKTKSPSHSLFFIPLEAWAIIIPALFVGLEIHTAEIDAKELAFIENPAINDKYLVDFTKLNTDADKTYKYGILKVISIQSNGVEVVVSELAYDKKSGVRKDLKDGKADKPEYYPSESFLIETNYLIELKNTDSIFEVSRI